MNNTEVTNNCVLFFAVQIETIIHPVLMIYGMQLCKTFQEKTKHSCFAGADLGQSAGQSDARLGDSRQQAEPVPLTELSKQG